MTSSLRFNENHTLYVYVAEDGVHVCSVQPYKHVIHIPNSPDQPPISKVDIQDHFKYLALVPGGDGHNAANAVLVFDLMRMTIVHELGFSDEVLAVRMRREMLVVVRLDRIQVYPFPDASFPQMLLERGTRPNPRGLCEVTYNSKYDRTILAYPGQQIGSIIIEDISTPPMISTTIDAHKHELACITFNQTGRMIATASENGNYIRVFSVTTGTPVTLYEFYRGSSPATTYCINFAPDNDYLCSVSSTGTVHIFSLDNTGSWWPLSYLIGARSQATFKVSPDRESLCAFGSYNNGRLPVYAVSAGKYAKYKFSEATGLSYEACRSDEAAHDQDK